jgi:hypothetical protein
VNGVSRKPWSPQVRFSAHYADSLSSSFRGRVAIGRCWFGPVLRAEAVSRASEAYGTPEVAGPLDAIAGADRHFRRGDEQLCAAERAPRHRPQPRLDRHHAPRQSLEIRTVAVMACDDEVLPLQEYIESIIEQPASKRFTIPKHTSCTSPAPGRETGAW